jgi:hypothetical protein
VCPFNNHIDSAAERTQENQDSSGNNVAAAAIAWWVVRVFCGINSGTNVFHFWMCHQASPPALSAMSKMIEITSPASTKNSRMSIALPRFAIR